MSLHRMRRISVPDSRSLIPLPAAVLLLAAALWAPACAPGGGRTAPGGEPGAATDVPAHTVEAALRDVDPRHVARVPAVRPAMGEAGMVVSAHALASAIGDDVLRRGGNAVDAAVATGFALAVVYPRAGNIGGGGFMILRLPDGTATAIDFREKAPLSAHPEMWLDESGAYDGERHHLSHQAVGVPGTVAGLAYVHERYGSMPWAELVEPAVRLADDGFAVTSGLAASLESFLPRARRNPATLAAFYRDGEPYRTGDRLRQPELARSLERIRDRGAAGFYQGETARLLVAEMERGGGLITLEDLARYQAVEREPITGDFHGYGIIGMPPPSSGGTAIVEMLNILEGYDLRAMGHNSDAYLHHLAEAMRRAYRDRARHVADPDFVDVPVDRLTSEAYAAELRAGIDPDSATPSTVEDTALAGYESPETTHYSVVDGRGMAVSTTYTLEYSYGSGITVPGAGFLLNNEMGDFNPAPGLTTVTGHVGTRPNLAEPEKRMLSSMTPVVLTRPDGGLLALVGSPGGRTIINTVLQVSLNLMAFDMGILEAVEAPRIHHQWLPDYIRLENAGWPEATLEGLRRRGHRIDVRGQQGHAHSIAITARGIRHGAPDPRDADAAAVGH